MPRPSHPEPLDQRLAAMAARYLQSRQQAERQRLTRFERSFALARAGIDVERARGALDSGLAADLDAQDRERLRSFTLAELARAKRYARMFDPRYDLSRHVAARRLLAWLEGERDKPLEAVTEDVGPPFRGKRSSRRRMHFFRLPD